MVISNGSPDDLGFSIKPKKLVKAVGKGVKKVGKATAKAAVTVAKLPATLAIALVMKAATTVAGVVCKAPRPILVTAATGASVNIDAVSLFCAAMNAKNTGQIRAHLPAMIKLTARLAATGAFPAAGPALQALKYIPGLSGFAGTDDATELLDAMTEDEIGYALAGVSDDEINESLGIAPSANLGYGMGLGLGAVALASGLFFALRR